MVECVVVKKMVECEYGVCGIVEVRGWRVRNEVSDRAINAVEKSERGVACCKSGWKRAGGYVWEKIKKRES